MDDVDSIRRKFLALMPVMDERVIRLWAATEAEALGHGGIRGGPDWTMKRDMLSPRYTTHWNELPLVKAA